MNVWKLIMLLVHAFMILRLKLTICKHTILLVNAFMFESKAECL